jgi:hypothetical protein
VAVRRVLTAGKTGRNAYEEWRKRREELEGNRLYFYDDAGRSLSNAGPRAMRTRSWASTTATPPPATRSLNRSPSVFCSRLTAGLPFSQRMDCT